MIRDGAAADAPGQGARGNGKGLAANAAERAPRWVALALVFLLVAANTFNIAADIAAMGESLSLVIGGLNHEHALIFAAKYPSAGFHPAPPLRPGPQIPHPDAVRLCRNGADCEHPLGHGAAGDDLVTRGFQCGLFSDAGRGPRHHHKPVSVLLAGATVIGFGLGSTGIDAIHMLVWSAVLNGIVAVPVMAMMMVIVSSREMMGRFSARPWLITMGWIGTAVMAMAVMAMAWSFFAH